MIAIQLSSTAEQALARCKRIPQILGPALAAAMDRENELTVGHISIKKLSQRGPETLGVVTNRLRSSLRRTKATVSGNSIASAIGTNVVYAGVHEFGFNGTVNVKGFTRKRSRIKFDGKFISKATATAGGMLTKAGKLRKSANASKVDTTETVRPFTRQMRVKARAPISKGIAERVQAYSDAISKAVTTTLEGNL